MQLIYENVDITAQVDIVSALNRDVAGCRCDGMEIVFEDGGKWMGWKPAEGDRMQVVLDGYNTGELFINTILPEEGRYRVFLSSMPKMAGGRRNASYEGKTLNEMMALCASECGMRSGLYGVDGGLRYPYLLRENESAPAFLSRILEREGATLKISGGEMKAIGVEYAQKREAVKSLEVKTDGPGCRYIRHERRRLQGLTIVSPYARASAVDRAEKRLIWDVRTDIPAENAAVAGRYARGLLLMNNRKAEEMTLQMEFDPAMTALERVDILSTGDAGGRWLVEDLEHDFINRKSRVKMLRCVESIW